MENKSLKSYSDIVKYLEYLEQQYNKYYDELRNINIGIFEFSGKKEKEERQRKLKGQLLNYVVLYEQCDRFLRDATTFRRQDFVRFLADFFSLIYGKQYVSQSDISDKKQSQSVITYDLIISEEDFKNFGGNDNFLKSLDFNELFRSCNDCCLLLDNSLKFTLLDGKELSSDFEDFPELIGAAISLVDLKLSNPQMSDQRRLKSVLNGNFMVSHQISETDDSKEECGPKLGKSYPSQTI